MKRALPLLLLVCLLSVPVNAGEIPIGPTQPPPTCTQNCLQEPTAPTPIPYDLILLLILKLPRV